MIILISILLLASFLYLDRAFEYMTFIGDHAWFFLSARDMILSGQIPLVGITASHTWLHQGPFWTYLIAPFLVTFNFHPGAPLILTSLLGLGSILLLYKTLKEFINIRIAYIASALFSFSPLVIMHVRNPYHTTPVIFFVILLIFSLLKWTSGNTKYFIFSILTMSILYNFHLSTIVFWLIILFYLIYGFIKREKYVIELRKKSFLVFTILAVIIPMIPILLYDFQNGFYQTVGYAGWVVLSAIGLVDPGGNASFADAFNFFLNRYEFLLLPFLKSVSVIFFILSLVISVIRLTFKPITSPLSIITLLSIISLVAYFITRTTSEAYLVMLFPLLIILVAYAISLIKNNIFVICLVALVSILNISFLLRSEYTTKKIVRMEDKLAASHEINKIANGRDIHIVYKGVGEEFESSKMPYEYITWWRYGLKSSENGVKILVNEQKENIIIKEIDE